mgnify:CR=1 FL=1
MLHKGLKSQGAYNLRSSGGIFNLLASPAFRTKATLGDRSFQVAVPKLWNDLPFETKLSSSVAMFKSHLKTHRFRATFR